MKKINTYKILLSYWIVHLIVATAMAQDPSLPPSENFDLTKWKITLPDQSEVKEQELNNGFESPNEFYTDPTTGAMVFRCPNNGATGGSKYPRSELREMLRAGNTSISTTGIGLNNWVFSSSSQSVQDQSGAVDGTMTATVAVDHVSTTGESSMVGRVIIGQIHASDNEPCRIYYRKLPNNNLGSIYIAHEPNTTAEEWYEMIGSRSSSASNPTDGIALGEKFSYEIKVEGNELTVTIIRPDKQDVVQVVDMSSSGFEDDWMYFKAGNYNQNNSGDAGDYAQVSFFALNVSHGQEEVLNTNATDGIDESEFAMTTYPNPFIDRVKISYELAKPESVKLSIYNPLGQKIADLVNEFQNPGKKTITWENHNSLQSGIYFAKLRIGYSSYTLKLIQQH